MTRQHQLETTLRALGLSGMLDTLDARLAQAHAGELGQLEFLQALCEDEIARREAAALVRRVHAARFEETVTLEDFDFAYNPQVPAALIRDLTTLRFLDAGESVILHGPVGVGKTMIAQALGHGACRRGVSVAFTKTSRLLADLAGGHADRSFEARLRRWARPGLLILDDFACATSPRSRPTISTSSSPSGPAAASSSPPTVPRPTGIRSSPTRWWPSRSSIGSSTPAT